MKIAIQGFKGSYSHQAVTEIGKKLKIDFEIVEGQTFEEAFKNIKKYGLGLIPVENSTAGFVEQTIDELKKYNFEIIGEYELPIQHCLLGLKNSDLKKIKKVFSHKQALLQTSNFLKKNKIKALEYFDTAMGAKFIKEKNLPENGAIGAEILSQIYDLKILAKNINNNSNNHTRFFLIKKKNFKIKIPELKNGEWKSVIIFKTQDIPGSLYKTLGGFATNNINLLKIFSRPDKEKYGYYFYLEFEKNLNNKEVIQALKEVKFFSQKMKILGSFQKI